jgi:hypothetical protein
VCTTLVPQITASRVHPHLSLRPSDGRPKRWSKRSQGIFCPSPPTLMGFPPLPPHARLFSTLNMNIQFYFSFLDFCFITLPFFIHLVALHHDPSSSYHQRTMFVASFWVRGAECWSRKAMTLLWSSGCRMAKAMGYAERWSTRVPNIFWVHVDVVGRGIGLGWWWEGRG